MSEVKIDYEVRFDKLKTHSNKSDVEWWFRGGKDVVKEGKEYQCSRDSLVGRLETSRTVSKKGLSTGKPLTFFVKQVVDVLISYPGRTNIKEKYFKFFIRRFGPLERSLINVSRAVSYKNKFQLYEWIHGFHKVPHCPSNGSHKAYYHVTYSSDGTKTLLHVSIDRGDRD